MSKKKIFIIAEVGNLHNGELDLAKRFIKEVAICGADAVKFQTHIFSEESLTDAPAPSYFKEESRKDYFERTAFTLDEWRQLRRYAQEEAGIEFMSSVFSAAALDFLEQIGVQRHKVPSGEVNNFPLLERIAAAGKPVLLSSGMSAWQELDTAVEVLKNKGCRDITILQCTSIYPCPPQQTGLNILEALKQRYNLPVGFSDHTLGNWAAAAAAVLGARVIEKHFTLSRNMYGSDAKHSLAPQDFKAFIEGIRSVEDALLSPVDKDVLAGQLSEMKIVFEKSIVAARAIPQGAVISEDMLSFKKPGDGMKAARYKEVVGRVAKVDIRPDTKIREEMLD